MPIENPPGGMRPQPPAINDPPASGGVQKPMRPQPPSMRNPPQGEAPEWRIGQESDAQEIEEEDDEEDEAAPSVDWERRAKDAMRFSTTYLDSNYRGMWDDALRAFNNQHPGDSKYNGENFKKRSHLFVPVTRTVIRKNEAAACQAFFSNQDLLDMRAMNEGDPKQVVSAAVMKELVQHRLTHSIPWFQTLLGGLQDAQSQGACVARIEWRYSTRVDAQGKTVVNKDRPEIVLIPLENFRFDPSAHWTDPVNTSPYVIELIPMYVGDIKAKMSQPNPKGQQWYWYSDAEIKTTNPDDSTRQARIGAQQDPSQETRDVSDYDIAWVQRHIHRADEQEWEFYTLNDGKMLTDPELLEKTVFHGKRPYVLGVALIETHKPLPVPIPTLVKPLQDGINAIENQRNDNVLFVLNKRYKVKRGSNVDTASLVRNVPSGITMVDSMEDLEEMNWPDVTASAYQEQDRKRQAFDDLVGNFNPMQLHQAGAPREAQGTIRMLQGPASVMTEYLLMTYAMTFVIPCLRQLVLLEQHYETDQAILAIAGQKAKVLQKFGVDTVTDDMLEHELTTTVNVGMGATDPTAKMMRFMFAVESFSKIAAKPPAGVNLSEVWKETMALAGYQDGERFSNAGNPELARLEQQNKQLMMKIQDLLRHKSDKDGANIVRLVTARETNATRERIAGMQEEGKTHLTYRQHMLDQDDMLLTKVLGATMLPGEQPPPPVGEGQPGGGAAAAA